MTACFPTATLVAAYRWRHGAVSTNDVRSTGASRRKRQSVQQTTNHWLSTSMHPPARQQHAIGSTVIQSLALARQMVSPTDGLIRRLAPKKSVESLDHLQTNCIFKLEPRSRCTFVLIVTVGEPGRCIGFKCSQRVGSSTGIPVNRERQPHWTDARCRAVGGVVLKTQCSLLQVNYADLSE